MGREIRINPYAEFNKKEYKGYTANFHQHSTETDGTVPPAFLIEQAVELGADIFQISGHDSYRLRRGVYPKVVTTRNPSKKHYDPKRPKGDFKNVFPFSPFDEDLYYDPEGERNYTVLKRKGTKGEFDIDENDLMQGMLALEGCEFTENHHMIVIDSEADGFENKGTKVESDDVYEAERKGGIVYFAHPGDHSDKYEGRWYDKKYSPLWYSNMLKKHSNLIGMEVFNSGNRFKNDEKMWDKVNNTTFDTGAIWGFSGTDSHADYNLTNHNVVFMKELTKDEMRKNLINGNFYFIWGDNPPVISNINVDEADGNILVETESEADTIEWLSGGLTIGYGNKINYNEVLGISNFIRAKINGVGGLTLTNPIYFNKFVKEYNFV